MARTPDREAAAPPVDEVDEVDQVDQHAEVGGLGALDEVGEHADVAALSYEDARDELSSIVARLEGGQLPLEEGMRLWRRGEALAAHCSAWLDGAQRQIAQQTGDEG